MPATLDDTTLVARLQGGDASALETLMERHAASAAILLALFQILTAARVFELLHFRPAGRFWGRVHRVSGYLAILLTLPAGRVRSISRQDDPGALGTVPGMALPVAGALPL